jgi:cation diffusion facilitator family transporter
MGPFRDEHANAGTQGRLGTGTGFRDKSHMTASSLDDAHAATRSVTRLSMGMAVMLIALKAFALGASGSVSILASLADSSLDLLASLATFFAVRWAAAPPDEEHRFGHGKGEAMAALVQAGLVFASSVFIGWEAVQRLFDPRPVTAGSWGVGVMLISMALTGWLIWRQSRAIKASGSVAVAADRAHYASDLAANVVVLIGIISGAFLSAPGLDAAAGLVVAVWLFWGATSVLRDAADQLLDRATSDTDRAAITSAVLADPQITGVHRLRTRQTGPVTVIQMHVDMAPTLTLAEAHDILEAAEKRLLAQWPHADILIHPDPRGPVQPEAAQKGPWS